MKKGFTLVELLAVLTLLAVVTLISVPIMDTILDNSNKKTKNTQIKEIISAAQKYVIKYNDSITYDNDNEYLLTLDKLKNSEFLDNKKYINPDDKNELNGCVYIKYNDENSKYKYSYIYNCAMSNVTSSNSCFTFNSSNGEITGRNISNSNCDNEELSFPTSIDGVKIRKIKSFDKSYLTENINKIDLTKSIYLDEIDNNSFIRDNANNSDVENLDLSNNSLLNIIGNNSFKGLNIKNVLLPDNLKYIGIGAFKDNAISNIVIPENVETIQEEAFYKNNIQSLVIPSSVTTLGNNSFSYNKLTSVIINNKKNESDFTIYNNPFTNNNNFTTSNIVWKN